MKEQLENKDIFEELLNAEELDELTVMDTVSELVSDEIFETEIPHDHDHSHDHVHDRAHEHENDDHGHHHHHHSHNHGSGDISNETTFFAGRMMVGILFLILSFINGLNETVFIVFSVIALLACGINIFINAIHDIKEKDFFSENVLMSVAGIVAVILGETFEGVMIMLLSDIGELLQDRAVSKSRDTVSKLLMMRPDNAKVLVDGEIVERKVDNLHIGDIIIVSPGERVAADGVILKGTSTADTSSITGEYMPVELEPGKNILSGYINLTDTITVRVTTEFADSTVSRILKLVDEAEHRKGKTERFITGFCRIYTPLVFGLAVVLGLFVPLIGSLSYRTWIYRALILLVISCPCALVISVPLTYFTGIGGASKSGILFKNANAVDASAALTSIFFDKTGTITTGTFEVKGVFPEGNINEEKLMFLASYAEAYSHHPIAKSILAYSGVKVDSNLIDKHHEERGKGTIIKLTNAQTVAAGNIEFMGNLGVKGNFVSSSYTSVYVAVNKIFVGRIDLGDTIKESAAETVRRLRVKGVENIALMTGDNALAATNVGKAIGISEIYSDCLPQDKTERLKYVLDTKEKDDVIAFVGDGINDGPVLALADIGIAMGGVGSDAAIETADVIIMNDEPAKIADMVDISKNIRKIVIENITLTISIKFATMILATLGMLSMWLAVFADVGVAMIAILNAARALKKK